MHVNVKSLGYNFQRVAEYSYKVKFLVMNDLSRLFFLSLCYQYAVNVCGYLLTKYVT